jgi:hypothetical protein
MPLAQVLVQYSTKDLGPWRFTARRLRHNMLSWQRMKEDSLGWSVSFAIGDHTYGEARLWFVQTTIVLNFCLIRSCNYSATQVGQQVARV